MDIIVFAIIVIILAALVIYAVRLITLLTSPFNELVQALVILLAVAVIANKAGII